MSRFKPMFLAALVACALAPAAYADSSPAKAAEIQGVQQEIDSRASLQPDEIQKKALASKFGVTEDQVQSLRKANENKGWGEITVMLAVAKQMSEKNKAAYADTNAALADVQARRAENKKWDEIAGQYGIDLSPVADDVRAARDEFKAQGEGAGSQAGATDTAKIAELRSAQQEIDGVAAKKSDTDHIQALTSQFGVSQDVIKSLRDENRDKGWGEIAVQLAMAQQLHDSNPSEYADIQSALTKIRQTRKEGKNWEETVRNYHLNVDTLTGKLQTTVQAFKA